MKYATSILTAFLIAIPAMADQPLDPRFFANEKTERVAPQAFALQPESAKAVQALLSTTLRNAKELAQAIRADEGLFKAIQSFARLTVEQRVEVLKKVFAYEVKTLKIKAPELIIGPDVTPGSAYFDFDPDKGGTGRVLINTSKFLSDPKKPLDPLMLLIHETRHSAQFQFAFQPEHQNTPLAKHFAASFRAQKALSGKLSYLDFMTLLNEYEAFQYGNYAVGLLSRFFADTDDMGSYASQFTIQGALKINLPELHRQGGSISVLDQFNELEKVQYKAMHP